MRRRVAVLDACVLYPAGLRDFLLRLAAAGAYRPRWSSVILDEVVQSIQRNLPALRGSDLARTAALMNEAFPEAAVVGFESLIHGLALPDPDDRHVLAAAIKTGAATIVTLNLKDFPQGILAFHGVTAVHPDAFVLDILDSDPGLVGRAFVAQLQALKNPPLSGLDLLAKLSQQGLVRTAERLRRTLDPLA